MDLELSHMADVEQACGRSDRAMLLSYPAVFDGHIPSAEWNQACSELFVDLVQRSSF